MCTVAVVAGPAPGGGYIVAHNRDERRTRSRGIPPAPDGDPERRFLCPSDPDGGGTWIAVNRDGLTLCMLNAPDQPPGQTPAMPVSRGTIPLELIGARSRDEVRARVGELVLARYRPFHLVAVDRGGILELRWNGKQPVSSSHRPPALFVSSSLHPISADRSRGKAWERFLAETEAPDRDSLASFMESHEPEKGSLSTCMHREDAATVSRTLVTVGAHRIGLEYTDGRPCDSRAIVTRYELKPADSPR